MALTQSTCSALPRLPFPIGASTIHIALRVPSIRQLPWKRTHPRRKSGQLSFGICASVHKSRYGTRKCEHARRQDSGWRVGRAKFPLEVACNITASEVTRNSGDLPVPGRHDPSAPDYQRTIPSSLGKAAKGLVTLPEGRKGAGAPFPISPGKTTSSNFRCEVPAWVPDLKKKGGGRGRHVPSI